MTNRRVADLTEIMVRALRDIYVTTVPDPVVRRIRASRKNGLYRKAGVVFVHVPRSAGNSICNALYGQFLGHFTINDVLKSSAEDVLKLPRFAIVRNPWDRAVSAYHYAIGGGGVDKMVRIRRPKTYLRDEFSSFESFVVNWLACKDLAKLDVVFHPQSFYVSTPAGQLPFDHVGRFEHLDQTVAWLQSAAPGFAGIAHTNASPRSDYAGYYNAWTRDAVADLYAEDIKLFGYRFDS